MSKTIRLFSGGAAQGLVTALTPAFKAETGYGIDGTFGAVGAMRERLLAGEPADLVILTAALIRNLAADGVVLADGAADLGEVQTSIAVREGDVAPQITDGASLRAALLASDEIYLPDPEKATAGIHFAGVLDRLGLGTAVKDRLRPFPNGASAMAALARSTGRSPIGCTQVTEILATPGLISVGHLPAGFDLATVYTAAPCTAASHPAAAQELIRQLSSADASKARAMAGFS
ncbi:MAG TPA: substrate-binding domain-containing protein [Enterovirga sp.]